MKEVNIPNKGNNMDISVDYNFNSSQDKKIC